MNEVLMLKIARTRIIMRVAAYEYACSSKLHTHTSDPIGCGCIGVVHHVAKYQQMSFFFFVTNLRICKYLLESIWSIAVHCCDRPPVNIIPDGHFAP